MNRWGSDESGPGGDPSWLGGKDRGGQGEVPGFGGDGQGSEGVHGRNDPLPNGQSGWSSDFGPGSYDRRADQDFGSSSSPGDAPEHTGPRFGSFGEGGVDDGSDHGRGRDAGNSSNTPTLKQVIGGVLPMLVFVVVAIVFFRADFSFWWIAFVIILPTIQRISRMFGGNRRR